MRLLSLPLLFALTGCAGIDYLTEHYGHLSPQTVETRDGPYWVYDKPEEGRVAVQVPPGRAALQGIGGGLALNPTVTAPPKPLYQQAAETYLSQTGRQCRITDGYLVVSPTWEFRYSCT